MTDWNGLKGTENMDDKITLKKKPLTVTGTAKQKAEIAMVNLAGHARSQMHFITQDVQEVKNVLKDEGLWSGNERVQDAFRRLFLTLDNVTTWADTLKENVEIYMGRKDPDRKES